MSTMVASRADWRDRAECRRVPPEMFDTPDSREPGVRRAQILAARHALAVCGHCPVIVWCRADATAVAPPVGVIRAGDAYNNAGGRAKRCLMCHRPILTTGNHIGCEDHGGLP